MNQQQQQHSKKQTNEQEQKQKQKQELEQDEPTMSIAWGGLSLVFLTPALGGFLYGYDIGATSFVLAILNRGDGSHHHHHHHQSHHPPDYYNDPQERHPFDYWWKDFHRHQWQQGLTVAAVSLGALIGSHIVLTYLSTVMVCSRRTELRVAAALYLAGAACNMLSGTGVLSRRMDSSVTAVEALSSSSASSSILSSSISAGWLVLLTGRLLTGVGVGFCMHGAPTYMVEMAPSQVRGAVVAAKESVIVLGIVVGYFAGDVIASSSSPNHHSSNHWVHLYAISFAMAIPMLVLTFFIPRSKRWLLMHGMRKEAEESMRFVYHGNIRPEFDKMVASIEKSNRFHKQPLLHSESTAQRHSSSQHSHTTITELGRLFAPSSRPALTAAMGLIVLQQCSGQPSIISYATILFDAAGWNGHATVATAMLMLAVSSAVVVLVDRVGRKRLLLTCCAVLSTALITLSAVFCWSSNWNKNENDEQNGGGTPHDHERFGAFQKNVILIAMFAYIGGYQIGFGPITWLVVSEVFPLDVRGPATALGVELNYLLQFLVQFLVPVMQDSWGWGPTFGLFACACLSAGVFVHRYVPETAGLTLEEIEEQLMTTTATATGASGGQHDRSDHTATIVSLSSEQSPLMEIEQGAETYQSTSWMEL
jgi:sugar porter (SP) family MFS transporter